MKLKQKWGTSVWEANNALDLIELVAPYEIEDRLRNLSEIVGRVIDQMHMTDQQKLDLIDPYSAWEIVE